MALQTTILPSATLAEFYRLAVLLAGSAKTAERVMAEVLVEAERHMEQIRNESSRRAWLATRIRERCLAEKAGIPQGPGLVRGTEADDESPGVLKIEAFLLAQRFHALPEPERTALALFYLDLFSTEEIGRILKLKPEELAATLGHARTLLRDSLKAMRDTPRPAP